MSIPALFISFIASAAASFTSLEPSPVIINARSITSAGISHDTPLASEASAVIAAALTLDSLFPVSSSILLTISVNSLYFNPLAFSQNFFTANISPESTGFMKSSAEFGDAGLKTFFLPFTPLFLRTIRLFGLFPVFNTAFFPDNSLTLNILLLALPAGFGILLFPFLLATISDPLSTSSP